MRLTLIFLLYVFFSSSQTVPQKVLQYAKDNFRKKVDRGECWDLANAALQSAGAQWTPPYGFGDKIDQVHTAPGDLLQFSNIKMKFPNGTMSFPKHTAIVYVSSGKQITLIHQNFNNKRFVDTITINLTNVVQGKIEAFRPK